MAYTQTDIVNMATLELGETQIMDSIDTQATEGNSTAITARLIWDRVRKKLLRDFDWPFARKYAPLTLFEGTVSTAATPDNIFNYLYPEDAVEVRRLTDCNGLQSCRPPLFRIGRKQVGGSRLVMTNLQNALAEYTVDVTDPAEWDESFTEMFVLKLALELAPSESRMTEIVKGITERYEKSRVEAVSRAAAEAEYGLVSGEHNPRIRDIFNLAVTMVGIARSAVSVDPELNWMVLSPRVCFHDERDYVLREFPWPFARKYKDLILIAGSQTEPVNNDWTFAYRLPEDCLYARRLTTGLGKLETNPPKFDVGSNYELANDDDTIEITLEGTTWLTSDTITLTASEELFSEEDFPEVGGTWIISDGAVSVSIVITEFVSTTVLRGTPTKTVPVALRSTPLWQWTRAYIGNILFTHEEEANLEYTRESENPDEWDAMFFQLLARRIAWLLAPSIAKGKRAEERAELCGREYLFELERVKRTALNESQREDPPDAEWVRDR